MSGDTTAERDALILLCRMLDAERDEALAEAQERYAAATAAWKEMRARAERAEAERDEYKRLAAQALDQLHAAKQ